MACCGRVVQEDKFIYVWTDGSTTVEYDREVKARARVIRSGGSYSKQEKKA